MAIPEKTQPALFARKSVKFSMPPLVWRVLDLLFVMTATAALTLVIVVTNSFLLGKGSYLQGTEAWSNFILRPDIIGTVVVTSLVAVAYMSWRRPG